MLYADYNGTTPLGKAAKEAMDKAMACWGNPSSVHKVGREAEALLSQCRKKVADALGVRPDELVFTSGGSEADSMALMGLYFHAQAQQKKPRILTTNVEHAAVKDTAKFLQTVGAEIEYLAVKCCGSLDLGELEKKVAEFKPDLVSIMAANNETGVVYPIDDIAKFCKSRGILFHTDAVQAFGKMDPKNFNAADLIAISAHKVHGPKGIGALVVKRGVQMCPTHFGGAQEVKRRGGTQNMVGIAGFAGACEDLCLDSEVNKLHGLRERFETKLIEAIKDVEINGCKATRLANTSNVYFPGLRSDVLMAALDLAGLCASAGSACSSGSGHPSHVLQAMGFPSEKAGQCIRFSWGRPTTQEDVDAAATLIIDNVNRIRSRKKAC